MSHKFSIRIVALVLLAMGSSCTTMKDRLIWKYETTPDKKVLLGRKETSVSIKTEGVTVRFDVPKGWKIVSCVEQRMVWHYVASAPDASLAFGVKIVRFKGNPPLEDRYSNYLAGLQQGYDPNIVMAVDQPFLVNGKTVSAYRYYSQGWGQRIVVMIPNGEVTTVFEFIVPPVLMTPAQHTFLQKIISTYSIRKN